MVRIVAGEVIHDIPQRRGPAGLEPSPRKPNYQIFPSTSPKIGIFAKNIALFGFESELIWILILIFMVYFSGYFWAIIIAILLWLYQKNSLVGYKKSKMTGMGDVRDQ